MHSLHHLISSLPTLPTWMWPLFPNSPLQPSASTASLHRSHPLLSTSSGVHEATQLGWAEVCRPYRCQWYGPEQQRRSRSQAEDGRGNRENDRQRGGKCPGIESVGGSSGQAAGSYYRQQVSRRDFQTPTRLKNTKRAQLSLPADCASQHCLCFILLLLLIVFILNCIIVFLLLFSKL